MPLDFSPAPSFMKEPVRGILWAHPGTMARDGFLLFFFILSPFSLPLIRLHRKSELPFVCNGESRKGEGARSAAREKKEWKRSRRRGRMRRVRRVAWEQRKATRRKMQRIPASPLGFSLSPFFLSISFYFTLLRVSFSLLPAAAFLTLNLFRASTIYLQASNKKK